MRWFYFDWISFTILYLNLTFCYRAFTFSPLFSPRFFLRCFISFFFLSFDYFLDELYRLYPHEFQNAQLMAKEDVDMHKWTDSRRWNRRSPLCQFWYHAHTIIFFFESRSNFFCVCTRCFSSSVIPKPRTSWKRKKTIFFRIEKSLKWRPGPAFHIEMILVNAHKINFKYLHSYYSFSVYSSPEQITNFF